MVLALAYTDTLIIPPVCSHINLPTLPPPFCRLAHRCGPVSNILLFPPARSLCRLNMSILELLVQHYFSDQFSTVYSKNVHTKWCSSFFFMSMLTLFNQSGTLYLGIGQHANWPKSARPSSPPQYLNGYSRARV